MAQEVSRDEEKTPKAEERLAEKPSTLSGEEHPFSIEQMADEAVDAFRRGSIMDDAKTDADASSDDRLIALLCYWSQIVMPLVLPIIVLLSESGKHRSFQRYHAMQSLGLVGGFIGISILVTIGTVILQIIPLVGFLIGFIALCLSPIAYGMCVIALLLYGWQAHKGNRFTIPGLSSLMRDQGWLR